MVAGHHDGRQLGQLVEKLPGGGELLRLGALREVAAGHDQVGAERRRDLQQRLSDVLAIGRAEVQVGNVQDGEHGKG